MNIVYIILAIIILIILACFFTAEYNTRGERIADIQRDRAIIEKTLRDSGASDDEIEDTLERIDREINRQIDDLSRGVPLDNIREYIPRDVNPDTIRTIDPDTIRTLASRQIDPDTIRTLASRQIDPDTIRALASRGNDISRTQTLTSRRDIAQRENDGRLPAVLQPTQIRDVNIKTRSMIDRDVVKNGTTR